MTHEEKLRALLPTIPQCSNKNCDECNARDCSVEDIKNYRENCVEVLESKVIMLEELLTVQETALMICENLYGDKLDESKPVRNLHIYAVAKIIVEAQNKKAGLV